MSFLHLKSDGPPIVEDSSQIDIFVRSLGWADLWSDIPPWWRHLMATFGTTSGQAELWSDIPPVETSSGQECYYLRSD